MRLFSHFLIIGIALAISGISFTHLLRSDNSPAGSTPFAELFKLGTDQDYQRLDNEIAEYRRALEFMTFASERRKLELRLISALREKVNLDPTEPTNWQGLLTAEYMAVRPIPERLFTMQRALAFNEWNNTRKRNLIHLCIKEDEVLNEQLKLQCDLLLKNTSWHVNLQHQAVQLRIDQKILEDRLRSLGIHK